MLIDKKSGTLFSLKRWSPMTIKRGHWHILCKQAKMNPANFFEKEDLIIHHSCRLFVKSTTAYGMHLVDAAKVVLDTNMSLFT